MTDLHIHILPGVDDGAEDMGVSLWMAESAWQCGVKALCATPHANLPGGRLGASEVLRAFERLCRKVEEIKIPLELFVGMEIFASEGLAKKLKTGELLSLNGSRYALVEFDFDENPGYVERVIQDLLEAGFVPVVAHPERYGCIRRDIETAYDWWEMGAVLQLNKGSLLGTYGRRVRQGALGLMGAGLIDLIASDGHGTIARTNVMTDAREFVEDNYGVPLAKLLFSYNPGRIAANGEIRRARLAFDNGLA